MMMVSKMTRLPRHKRSSPSGQIYYLVHQTYSQSYKAYTFHHPSGYRHQHPALVDRDVSAPTIERESRKRSRDDDGEQDDPSSPPQKKHRDIAISIRLWLIAT
jgi:hypothetical protein